MHTDVWAKRVNNKKQHKPFAEFLKWRPNYTSFTDHTLSSDSDICKIST